MRLQSERVIDTGGSPIYLVPRRDGRPGLLIAQGPSYVLFGRDDLRELQTAIAEELGEPHLQRFTTKGNTND